MFEDLDKATKDIIKEYTINKKPLRKIIKDNPEWKVHYSTIKNILNRAGFSLRTQSEAMKVYWKKKNDTLQNKSN